MVGRLNRQVAVVTGGCSGIGLAIVERFISEGAKVVIADIQDNKGRGLETHFSGSASYVRCDVTQEEDLRAGISKAAEVFGGLDILVNNAGVGGTQSGIIDMDPADWDASMNLLLRAPMLAMKHAAPLMAVRGGGSIINMASIAAFEAGWGLAYGVAKAALLHLTKLAAADFAKHRIRVNAICPGVIVTPIFGVTIGLSRKQADETTRELADAAARMQPIARAGRPEDVASAALYLASEDSSFVTGAHQLVDGGILVGQRISWDETALLPLHPALANVADHGLTKD